MCTSELKVSEMTKRATEQSVPPELLLEPGVVARGEDRDQHKQQLSLISSATQPRPIWRMGSVLFLWGGPCTYISFGGLGGQCPPS